jgi:large subunit ribosomal protein L30
MVAMAENTNDRKTLKVTQVRSIIGFNKKQGEIVRSLGLRRIRHTVELQDTPEVRSRRCGTW